MLPWQHLLLCMKYISKEVTNFGGIDLEEILIVDGYNIIGAWLDLRELKDKGLLDEARERLLDWLVEYKVYSGQNVIIVYDAHQISGEGKKYYERKVNIFYTKENETADELIEKLVGQLYHRERRIYVATSDYTEQRVIFAQGALRISARELAIERDRINDSIKHEVNSSNKNANINIFSNLDEETKKAFEKWRRS